MRAYKPRSGVEAAQNLFLYFLLYAIIGWGYEVFLEVVVYRWGYSDRGVLFGPYCPVYGVGALAFLLCFGWLRKKEGGMWFRWFWRPVALFLGCMVVATAIELATSYLLEFGHWFLALADLQRLRNQLSGTDCAVSFGPIRIGRGVIPARAAATV